MISRGGVSLARNRLTVDIRRRHLLYELVRREITDRYAGQVLGWLWGVITPLTFILVYVFLFAIVFQVKVPESTAFPFNYTVYLLSGLTVWLFVQDAISRSTAGIRANSVLVKQASFPLYFIPLKIVAGSSLSLFVSLTVVCTYTIISSGTVPSGYLLIPAMLVLLGTGVIGLSLIFSALGLFFRDLKDVVSLLLFVSTFLLPIFYLPDMVPTQLRFLTVANPFSYWIYVSQDVLYFGAFTRPDAWIIGACFSVVALAVGVWLFSKLSPIFGNEL